MAKQSGMIAFAEQFAQELITMRGLKRLNALIGKYTTVHDGG